MRYTVYILCMGLCMVLQALGRSKVAAQLPRTSGMRELLQEVKNKDTLPSKLQPASFYLSPDQKLKRVEALYLFEAGQQWLTKTRSSGLQLLADSLADAGVLSLGYQAASGGLHAPGTPYKARSAQLSTWGFRTLGRVKVGGYFDYEKRWEDSLAAALSPALDGITPYYYFTPKAGTYERQLYKMGFNLGYDLVKQRLLIGLGLDYLHNSSYGSVDPRLVGTHMQALFSAGIAYKKGGLLVGATLIKGYGSEQLDISYKNKRFQTGNSFPERDYYLNMGYGSIIRKSDRVRRNLTDRLGAQLDFAYQAKGLQLRGALGYGKRYQDSHSTPDTALSNDLLARYSQGVYQGWLQLKSTKQNLVQLWQLGWERRNGHDANVIFNGRNYFALDNELSLDYWRLPGKESGALKMEWGLGASYGTTQRTDILSAHKLSSDYLNGHLSLSLLLEAKAGSLWRLSYTPQVYFPLQIRAEVPMTQQNAFSERVLYPMARYLSTKKLSSGLQLGYLSSSMISGLYSGFELGVDYLGRLDNGVSSQLQNIDFLQKDAPSLGGSRLGFHLAFNIYL